MDVKVLKEKIDKLSQREKIISVIMVISVLFVVFNIMLYAPASNKAKSKKAAIENLNREIELITSVLLSQADTKKEPEVEKIELPQAEDLSGMLAAISREANAARVDFISISPENFEYKDKFVELKLKIELRVRFRELYDFLKSIETRHRLFLVQNLRFETNNTVYPSGIAVINAVTYLRKKE